jgi:hypothetical protein
MQSGRAPAQARTHKEDVVTVADKTGTTQREGELLTAHSHAELTARTEPVSNYTVSFRVDQNPKEVFDAINDVRGWWGEDVQGSSQGVGDEFTYRVQDVHYSKLRVTELVPNEKVAWLVLENHMNFVEDQAEWVGTTICFEISRQNGQTEVLFTHIGLQSQFECFDVCSDAWGSLMRTSLPSLITTGSGIPYAKGGVRPGDSVD